jgi:hypothetical protein
VESRRLPNVVALGFELLDVAGTGVVELVVFVVLDVNVSVAVGAVGVLVVGELPEPPESPAQPQPESADAAAAGPATNAQSITAVAARRRQPITAFRYDKSNRSLSLRLRG